MTFSTIEELNAFVSSLTPAQQRRLTEMQKEEMANVPIDPADLATARMKLAASGRWVSSLDEAVAILAVGANLEEDARKHRLRQAAALLRAAARLAAEEERKA